MNAQANQSSINKNHVEVGVYEERNTANFRKGSFEDDRLKKELTKFDPEIEVKLQQSKQWQHEMYKDFENPSAPTMIELLEKSIETLTGMLRLKESLFEAYQQERIKVLLPNLFQVLENLHLQYEMLSDILKIDNSAQEIAAVHEKYNHLGELALPIHDQSQICWKILAHCFDYLLKKLLLGIHKTMEYLFGKKGTAAESDKIDEIQIAIGKIRTVSEYLPIAAVFDQSDIFALEQSDPYLQELQKYVKIKVLGSSETVKKSFQRFIQGIHVGVSSYAQASVKEGFLAKKLTVSFGAAYYFFLSSEAQKQANLFYSQPHEKSAFELWNLLEDEFVAGLMKITLPSIKYAEKIHIKRLYEPVTLDLINQALNSKSLNNTSALDYSTQQTNPSEEITTLRLLGKINSDIDRKGSNKVPILVLSPKNLEVQKDSTVKLEEKAARSDLELSPLTEIVIDKKNPKGPKPEKLDSDDFSKPRDFEGCGFFAMFGCLARPDYHRGDPTFKELVIHIHGGGFVSMSSSSHQSYTRQWANILQKPVFSIDYRLAPEHPYPAALDDCWQAYNWILDHSEEVLGIRPEKIIITGDSAGGNLALGVTALAIKCGIKVPDGLFLAYPALRLEVKAFSPSLMHALEDQLIPYTLLKLCIQAYVPGDANPALDPLLCPIHLSEELLRKFPPIRMMVGDSDPLHDECWRFTDKLRKLGHDVFLTVYRDMCHGFLGYDVPMGMAESKACIQDSANMIGELLAKASARTSLKK